MGSRGNGKKEMGDFQGVVCCKGELGQVVVAGGMMSSQDRL